MSLIDFSYFVGGSMLMLALVGLIATIILPVLDQWDKRYFAVLFSALILLIAALILEALMSGNPDLVEAAKVDLFFEVFFSSFLVFLPALHLLHYCGKSWRNSPLFYAALTLWGIYIIILVVAQFTSFIFYLSPDNTFIRGPWYPLPLMILVVMLIIDLIAVIVKRRELSRKVFIAFLIYLFPLTFAITVYIFADIFLLIDISMLLAAVAMFSIILSEQLDLYRLQQKEIVRQKANVMVLQMRPHFIYNSLTSIYYLCEQDPKKAQQVVNDFTTYLRKNFYAISSDDTIPFLEELSHTRAYLAVEKALHEDLLSIDYDTPHTRFRIPPLTLQPIVENAIKHGMDPDAEPLHISIVTCKTDSDAEIIVTDNGVGFEPSDETNPQDALSNIRQRLEIMCSGKMIITPCEESGTMVRLIIPSQES